MLQPTVLRHTLASVACTGCIVSKESTHPSRVGNQIWSSGKIVHTTQLVEWENRGQLDLRNSLLDLRTSMQHTALQKQASRKNQDLFLIYTKLPKTSKKRTCIKTNLCFSQSPCLDVLQKKYRGPKRGFTKKRRFISHVPKTCEIQGIKTEPTSHRRGPKQHRTRTKANRNRTEWNKPKGDRSRT